MKLLYLLFLFPQIGIAQNFFMVKSSNGSLCLIDNKLMSFPSKTQLTPEEMNLMKVELPSRGYAYNSTNDFYYNGKTGMEIWFSKDKKDFDVITMYCKVLEYRLFPISAFNKLKY